MKQVVLDESFFLKSRVYKTAKRVGAGLKLATFLMTAVVAYAVFIKRTKLIIVLLILTVAVQTPLMISSASARAQDFVVPSTQKQIFVRSRKIEKSKALGLQGSEAFVVSTKGTSNGVLIRSVDDDGLAASVGMNDGDVILTLNGVAVDTAKQIDHAYSNCKGPVSVSFAHMGDAGLLLYNASFPAKIDTSGKRSESKVSTGAPQKDLVREIAQAEVAMLAIINQDRAKHNAQPVKLNNMLIRFARERSQDMVKRKYFDHIDPDGISPQEKARTVGIVNGVYENISWRKGYASIYDNAVACEISMMAEPAYEKNHRSNILDPEHMTVGVGIYVSGNGVVCMTEEFSHTDPQ